MPGAITSNALGNARRAAGTLAKVGSGALISGMLVPNVVLAAGMNTLPCDGRQFNALGNPNLAKVLPLSSGPRTRPGSGADFGNYTATSVAYGNGMFVASQISSVNGLYFTSPDGANWTQRQLPNTGAGECHVKFLNGYFVMGITNTYPYLSTDGISWSQPVSSGNNYTTCLSAGSYFYLGNRNTTLYIQNPTAGSWGGTSGVGGLAWGAAFGNGIYVMATDTGIYISTDGKNFTTGTTALVAYGSTGTQQLAFGNGFFVLLTPTGTYRSTDGVNWTLLQSTNIFNAVIFLNGTFFFSLWGQSSAAIWSSVDGLVYTSVVSTTGLIRVYEIATDGKQIVAAGVGADTGVITQRLPLLAGYYCVMG